MQPELPPEPHVKVLRFRHPTKRTDVQFRTVVQSNKGTFYVDMNPLDPGVQNWDYLDESHIISTCKNGLVLRGVNAATGEAKAIKIMSSDLICADPGASDQLAAEIHINQALQAPYHDSNAFSAGQQFVTCFDAMVNDPQLRTVLIVMPLVSGGELFTFIQQQMVDPQLLGTWLHQLCFALGYCHERKVVHRDIDPQNIMLTDDMDLRLIDFDQAEPVPDGGEIPGKWAGKESYVSYQVKNAASRAPGEEPPLILAKPQDVWSLAATVFALIHRQHPYAQACDTDPQFVQLCNGDWPEWPAHIPPGIKPVLMSVFQNWEHDAQRPTVAEFLAGVLAAIAQAQGAGGQ